jgi:hypothetical protein
MPLAMATETIDYKRLHEDLLAKYAEKNALIATLSKENRELRMREVPLSNTGYMHLANLQYKAKAYAAQVSDFKSGEKYVKMRAEHRAHIATKDREIASLKRELADSRQQAVSIRKMWTEVNEGLVKEHAKELAGMTRAIEALEKRLLDTKGLLAQEKEKVKAKAIELYQARADLEDEKGKNQKLRNQINRDYENSSLPSSQKRGDKKITNNRERTGKKPGGQPGHKGHPRKKHAPTNVIEIPAPEEYANSPDYKPTGKTITKQVVGIRVEIVVDEYTTPEFRHVRTRQRVHADFPDGVVNDVNYSGSIKAFAFLLNNYCNVSVKKVSEFLCELTGGELKISTGMINGLAERFSYGTEADQRKAFADILLSPVINTDFTSARVNGRNMNVLVCATPSIVLYFTREHKGHEGIKGSPIEDYQNILVHDHDLTFYKYGNGHQECLEHILRALKDSIDNEPNLKWNKQMRELIQEMIHFTNGLNPNDMRNPDQIDEGRVKELESSYDYILNIAQAEYEYEPPSKYYKDGFNLYKRMLEYRGNHLLFLHDRTVPHNNNLAERLLRILKRKLGQVMTFRSDEGLMYYCQSLGIIASLRARGQSLWGSVASIFDEYQKNISGRNTG